jgi:pyruvate/2-oxoglutarate/acetoin dehydrogenase E1 component
MYNDQVKVPMVVRTPMGGRRGYGPTHSQTLEKMFMGAPGLRTIAVNTLCNPGKLLENAALKDDDPVLFIEHKLLYPRTLLEPGHGAMADFSVETFGETYPAHVLRFHGNYRSDLTIACYGYLFELVRQVALDLLLEHEFFSEIVLFSQLSPFEINPLLDSIECSGRLLVVEEGGLTLGWGAELVSRVVECQEASKTSFCRRPKPFRMQPLRWSPIKAERLQIASSQD